MENAGMNGWRAWGSVNSAGAVCVAVCVKRFTTPHSEVAAYAPLLPVEALWVFIVLARIFCGGMTGWRGMATRRK